MKLDLADDAIFRMPYKADGTEATVFVERRVNCTNVGFLVALPAILRLTSSSMGSCSKLGELFQATPSLTTMMRFLSPSPAQAVFANMMKIFGSAMHRHASRWIFGMSI